jgi:hypothetical protein
MKIHSRYDKDYKFIYIDTLKHQDSILQILLESDDWHSIRLDVCNDNYETNAPSFMTTEEIRAEVASHKREGTLDVFYREMRNQPVAKETASFKQEYFRYYQENGPNLLTFPPLKDSEPEQVKLFGGVNPVNVSKGLEHVPVSDLVNVVICDPAKTVNLQSAESAVVGIGVDRKTQRIFIRDVVAEKFYPDELYDALFSMVVRLRAVAFGVEVTSLNLFITQPIENERRKRNVHAQFLELKAVGKKEERISALVPYYRQGHVYHNVTCSSEIESQLIPFPRSKRLDIIDAEAYIVKIIDELFLYFDPPDDDLDEEDEYQELVSDSEPMIHAGQLC